MAEATNFKNNKTGQQIDLVDQNARDQITELNETLTELDRYAAVGFRNNVTDNPWFKVCTYSTSANNADPYIKFLVTQHYLLANTALTEGVLTLHVRTNTGNSSGIQPSTSQLEWNYLGAGIDTSNFKIVCQKDDSSGLLTITLYEKQTVAYTTNFFVVLDEGSTATHERLWTLYNNISTVGGDCDELPEGTVIESTVMTLQNPVASTSTLSDDSRITALTNSIDDLTNRLTAIEHELKTYRAAES